MKSLITGLLIIVSINLMAQQLPYFRNEIYAPQWHNPASFGTWNTFSVNALVQQTSLFENYNYGSGLISAEGFVGIGNSGSGIGIGGSYLYDQIYIQKTHAVTAKFNCQFAFDKMNLSIGVSPGFKTIRQSMDLIPPTNINDTNLPPAGIQTKATLDAGIFLYTDRFYAGFSVNQFNGPFYDELNYQGATHYFLNAGYRFKVSKNIQLFPSIILGSDVAVSLFSATFLVQFMKPAITIGMSYAIARNISGMIGYDFKGFSILYGIGTNLSLLTNASYFHQEIRLSYRLKKKPKCSTCEYF